MGGDTAVNKEVCGWWRSKGVL